MVQAQLVIEACVIILEHFLPGRFARDGWTADLKTAESLLKRASKQAVSVAEAQSQVDTDEMIHAFIDRLPSLKSIVDIDIEAAFLGDPAAQTHAEIIAAYPGILAVVTQRLANELYNFKLPIVPRIMTEWAHSLTGIDIHPGAALGPGVFIDHGTGVVIGETAVVGRNVRIYQGATLGAKNFVLDDQGNPVKGIQRHPTVEDNVVIFANAVILGGDTVVGRNSIIGAGVHLSESVPANSIVSVVRPELRVGTQNTTRT